jgi:GDP-6-deoxy-D-talose 4-dehydrogenase
MKLLVTGLLGLTGHHLVPMATAAGWQVVGLDGDINDGQAMQDAIDSHAADALLHLAGVSFTAHPDSTEIYRVNTVGTTTLLQALVRTPKPPARVVLASSASIYGHSDTTPIAETQPPAPVSHYAASKLAMEHMARTYLDRLPVVIARPFNYTGPGQGTRFLVPKLVEHFSQKRPTIALGNLHIRREINDVRFVCEAYLRLIEAGEVGQAYNICTGASYCVQDLLHLLTQMTGHPIEVTIDPAFVRRDEPHELRGDPTRLQRVVGPLTDYSVQDTLQWMLDESQASRDG